MLNENDLVEHQTSSLFVHHCGNIPRSQSFRSAPSWDYVPRNLRQSKAGIMCWMANTHILPLHEVKHTKSEVERLNEHGLYIYLYEPLCSYITDDVRAMGNGFNCGFYSEYPSEFAEWDRNRSAELDSISYYAFQNNLTNVHVLTGDYNVEKYFPYYGEQLNLKCDDLFLRGLSVFNHINTKKKSREEITHDFVCTSWRYTPARNIIAAVLSRKKTHMSWFFKVSQSVVDRIQWLDIDDTKNTDAAFYKDIVFGMDRLNQRSPMCLDKITETIVHVEDPFGHFYPKGIKGFEDYANPVSVNPYTLPLESYYRSAFLDVVCESRFAQPTANVSEKVFQAIQFKTPFILVGPPYSIEYMKTLGYKTFDKWWDESYDTEENHGKRIRMIYDLINQIEAMSYDEKYAMYEDMWSVLKHNFDLHVSTTPSRELRDYKKIKWNEIQDKQWVAEAELDPFTGRPVGWD